MKRIGVLGTGVVGQTIASKLISLDYDVMMGSRTNLNEKASDWAKQFGEGAVHGTFQEAAEYGYIVFNCLKGDAAFSVLNTLSDELRGKLLIDLSNPLEMKEGEAPILIPNVSNLTSLAEQIQKALPETHVVKTLNTVTAPVMVEPGIVGEEISVFLSGNDVDAKLVTKTILHEFGWTDIIDLGDITTARGPEMFLPLWLRLYFAQGHANFGIKVVR